MKDKKGRKDKKEEINFNNLNVANSNKEGVGSNNANINNNYYPNLKSTINTVTLYQTPKSNSLEYFSNILPVKHIRNRSGSKGSLIQSSGNLNSNYNQSGNKSKSLNLKYFGAIQNTLVRKYLVTSSEYGNIVVDNLINNRNCHLVSVFKEYMILDYIDEFLKRGYKLSESFERIPKFANYYKNYLKFFCNPIFRDFKANSIIQSYGDNKAEMYYNRNYANKKKNEKKGQNIDDHLRTIFNSTVKNNIDKNSMTQTQQTIRNDLLEMSMHDIEVFKPSSGILDNRNSNCVTARDKALGQKDTKLGNEQKYKIPDNNMENNNSTHLNIGDDYYNINLQSFIENDHMASDKRGSNEESLLNILKSLNGESKDYRRERGGNYFNNEVIKMNNKITPHISQPIQTHSKYTKEITKPIEDKIIREFEEKIIGGERGEKERIVNIGELSPDKKQPNLLNKMKMNNFIEANVANVAVEATKSKISINEKQKENQQILLLSGKDRGKSNTQRMSNKISNNYESETVIAPAVDNLNSNQNQVLKSQKTSIKDEYRSLKLTKADHFVSNINPSHNLNLGAVPNHNKNVYSSEFYNLGTFTSNNGYNTLTNPPTLSKQYTTNSDKEKTTINSSNSNTNTPVLHMNKKSTTKLPSALATNESLKLKKLKSMSSNTASANNNMNNFNTTVKKNAPTVQYDPPSNKTTKNLHSPTNSNLINVNSPGGTSSLNDIMKITLSLYMDKSSRNRVVSSVEQAATQKIERKSSAGNKHDSINNFNININNQINIAGGLGENNSNNHLHNLNHLQTFSGILSTEKSQTLNKYKSFINNNNNAENNAGVNVHQINGQISSDLSKNVNANLKHLIDKNKTLSRNKNPSLYKLPSNQARSSTIQEEDLDSNIMMQKGAATSNNINSSTGNNKKDGKRGVKDMKMFSSYSNNIDSKQLFFNSKGEKSNAVKDSYKDIYRDASKKVNADLMIKHTLDDYQSYNRKKSQPMKQSNSPYPLQSELTSRNKNVLMASIDKKGKVKLPSHQEVRKLMNNGGGLNCVNLNTLNSNLSNAVKSNPRLLNIYQTTNSVSKKYYSSFKK